MKIALLLLAVAWPVLASGTANAQADIAACVADHKRVQTARPAGHILESLAAAARCAQQSCPQLIREDCAAWYVDIGEGVPSIVLDVRDPNDRDVPEAKVTLGERALDVHGRAIALDPGVHELRVEASGFSPRVERIVLHQGEKNRRVAITLRPIAGPAPAQVESRRAASPAVITLGAIGVAGLGTFVALGVTGKVRRDELDADHCRPDCAQADVDAVNRMYLGANVAAAVGGAAVIAATALYVYDRKRERRLQVALHPTGLRVRGAF